MESNQNLPLTACSPSLALISLQDSAGNSGIEPRGTNEQTQTQTYGSVKKKKKLADEKRGKGKK